MFSPILRSKFLAGLGLSLVLFALSLLIMRPYVTEAWDCAVTAGVLEYERLLQKIENDHKGDIYFWAWINNEGYLPKTAVPAASSCSRGRAEKMQDWVNNKLWAYVYPKAYQKARQNLLILHELNETVLKRIKSFEDQRESWWQPLSEDLKKICSLHQQVKRLGELKLHLSSNCLSSVNANPSCLSEIKNVEKLVEKEEAPFNENLSKMQSKWPYLAGILKNREFNCETQ